jgi:hypothetical protein
MLISIRITGSGYQRLTLSKKNSGISATFLDGAVPDG